MNQTGAPLESALEALLRRIVREEIATLSLAKPNGGNNDAAPYLTVSEAAKLSSLAPSTIRLLIRKRQLRAQKVGRRVLVKKTDLECFLASNPIETMNERLRC